MEKAQQQESCYSQLMSSHQSEVTVLKNQVASLKKDLEAIKTRYNETSEKLMEKTRQYQKLQVRDTLPRPQNRMGGGGARCTPTERALDYRKKIFHKSVSTL